MSQFSSDQSLSASPQSSRTAITTDLGETEMADYFSLLPDPIIHRILSFLPFDEIARTCVLSRAWYCTWITYPDLHLEFRADQFRIACARGLEDSLKKFFYFENLKVIIISSPYYHNNIVIEKLDAVSISSLKNFSSKSAMIGIVISSREETYLVRLLLEQYFGFVPSSISMICFSPESAELFYKKLGDCSIIKEKYPIIELVCPNEIGELPSTWEPFVPSSSRSAIRLALAQDLKSYCIGGLERVEQKIRSMGQ